MRCLLVISGQRLTINLIIMKTFVLDIESEPREELIELFADDIKAPKTYKDAEKIEMYLIEKKKEIVKMMSVDVDFCKIKCMALKEDDEPAKIVTLDYFIEKIYEQIKVIPETVSGYQERRFFQLITFNGKSFDLPVIIRECIRQKIGEGTDKRNQQDSVVRHLKSWCRKYNSDIHVDLMEVLCDGRPFRSLDKFSSIYLNWPKKEINFETCTMEELQSHNVDDVEMTAAVAKVFKSLF